MISTAQLAADLGYVIADLPAFATASFINGTAVVAVSELTVENTLVLAGNIDVRHFEMVLPLASCLAAPSVTDRVALTNQGETSSTNYEVLSFKKSPDGVAYHVIVKADHRN